MGIPEKNKTVRRIYSVLQLASSALKMENINVVFLHSKLKSIEYVVFFKHQEHSVALK